jgi:hypothetical protein
MGDPSRVRLTGPLTPFAEGFAAELARQGYTRNGVTDQVRLLAHLSRWLAAHGLDVSALTPPVMDAFLVARRGALIMPTSPARSPPRARGSPAMSA